MSETHTTVALAKKAKRREVVSAARQLAQAASTGSEVDLDLSELLEIDATWGAVLSNVLVGALRDARNLHVHMPSAARANAQLARSGMYFALARHPGLDWQDLHGWSAHLSRWRRDWRPTDLQEPLFDLAGERTGYEAPNPFDDQLVAFLNPDRAPREDAPNDQAAVVYPWLRDLMRHEGEVDPAEELDLHRQISLITWELLDNIREHAQLSRTGQSSLATFATRGRPNHLNLCVMDTGIGIPESLGARLGTEAGSDTALVEAALNGDLPFRGRSRGNGLLRIVSLVHSRPGAGLFVASGPTSSGGAIVVELSGGGKPVEVSELPVTMRGTVALVKLPFGIGRDASPSTRRRRSGQIDPLQTHLSGTDA